MATVKHEETIIEITDEERNQLGSVLCIIAELSNNVIKNETMSDIFIRNGIVNLREVCGLRDFVVSLKEDL